MPQPPRKKQHHTLPTSKRPISTTLTGTAFSKHSIEDRSQLLDLGGAPEGVEFLGHQVHAKYQQRGEGHAASGNEVADLERRDVHP